MDETDKLEDVQLFIDDNEVFIRQWNEANQRYDLIIMSHVMLYEFLSALNKPEGTYVTNITFSQQ